MAQCPICKRADVHQELGTGDYTSYECERCGSFKITNSILVVFEGTAAPLRQVSSWISEQNRIFNNTPTLDSDYEKIITPSTRRGIASKFDALILYLNEKGGLLIQDDYGFDFHQAPIQINHLYIGGKSEFNKIIEHGTNKGYLKVINHKEGVNPRFTIELTFEGLLYAESLECSNKNSSVIFFAFNFTKELKNVFDTTVKAILERHHFLYVRVSSSQVEHDVNINDEVVSQIKQSRMVVADVTNNRSAVYFEAGLAMGLKIPVIWTCREDRVDDMCFDTRQYPHILWNPNDPGKFAQDILNRIKALL